VSTSVCAREQCERDQPPCRSGTATNAPPRPPIRGKHGGDPSAAESHSAWKLQNRRLVVGQQEWQQAQTAREQQAHCGLEESSPLQLARRTLHCLIRRMIILSWSSVADERRWNLGLK
jgi:hypothetical protein